MGRAPCCTKVGLHRGPWTPREDTLLTQYIQSHGEGHWRSLPKKAGLLRCGKSCRLRWMNYLRPDIKRGNITSDEDDLIIRLHTLLGNRWSLIAGRLPGRTDNEIKNYWNTHLIKRLRSQGTNPKSHGRTRIHERSIAKNNSKSSNPDREPLKIYVPKPVRIFKKCNTSEPINALGSFGDGPCNFNVAANFISGGDDYHLHNFNFVNADFELDRCLPDSTDSSLDNIYEEYLQLLNANNKDDEDQIQLDSFAESFLI